MGRTHTVQDQPDRTIPEDTIVRAKLAEIAYETVKFTHKKGERIGEEDSFEKSIWWFEVTAEGEYKGRKIKGEVSANKDGSFLSNHPANKFRLWSSALLGRPVLVGENLEDDDIVGLSADITVRHEPDRRDPARKYERLDQVIPLGDGFDFDADPPF